jgi:hypothetical protein
MPELGSRPLRISCVQSIQAGTTSKPLLPGVALVRLIGSPSLHTTTEPDIVRVQHVNFPKSDATTGTRLPDFTLSRVKIDSNPLMPDIEHRRGGPPPTKSSVFDPGNSGVFIVVFNNCYFDASHCGQSELPHSDEPARDVTDREIGPGEAGSGCTKPNRRNQG